MSLGIGEAYLGVDNDVFTNESNYFMLLANAGVSTFVSSGDAGSTPLYTGHDSTGPLQAEYDRPTPTSRESAAPLSPSTKARGYGRRRSSGTIARPARPAVARVSNLRAPRGRPVRACPRAPSGSRRTFRRPLPPAPRGFLLYNGGGYYVSGTSWSAPTWAGFSALINQGRAVANSSRPPLGLLNPRIYPLIGTGNFYDITSAPTRSTPVTLAAPAASPTTPPTLATTNALVLARRTWLPSWPHCLDRPSPA